MAYYNEEYKAKKHLLFQQRVFFRLRLLSIQIQMFFRNAPIGIVHQYRVYCRDQRNKEEHADKAEARGADQDGKQNQNAGKPRLLPNHTRIDDIALQLLETDEIDQIGDGV